MSTFNTRRLLAGIALLGLMLGGGAAQAAGTLSGTSITNTATLVTATETVTSNTTNFTVDNKVKVTVTETNNTATLVSPGATGQVVTFTVTNDGNTTQDYLLTAANVASGATLFASTDNFDATNCATYVDSDNDNVPDSGEATNYIDQVAPDLTVRVFVVCDIPGTTTSGDFAVISLMATTHDGTGAGLGSQTLETSGANTSGVDVVFADAAGTETVDGARDGKHSARDAYLVSAATVTVSKNVALVCDPFNYNSNPKFIPGAYVQYTLTLTNTGSSTATLTSLTDTLNSNTALDPDLRTGSASACDASNPANGANYSVAVTCSNASNCASFVGPSGTGSWSAYRFFTHTADTDGATYSGGAGGTLTLTFGTMGSNTLSPGATMTIKFNAIIQ